MQFCYFMKKFLIVVFFFPTCSTKVARLFFVKGFRTRPSRQYLLQHPSFVVVSSSARTSVNKNGNDKDKHSDGYNVGAFCSLIWSPQKHERQWHRCMKMSSSTRSFSLRFNALLQSVSHTILNGGNTGGSDYATITTHLLEQQYPLKKTSATASSSFIITSTMPPPRKSSIQQRHRLFASTLISSTSLNAHNNLDEDAMVSGTSLTATTNKQKLRKRIGSWFKRTVAIPKRILSGRNRKRKQASDATGVDATFDTSITTTSTTSVAADTAEIVAMEKQMENDDVVVESEKLVANLQQQQRSKEQQQQSEELDQSNSEQIIESSIYFEQGEQEPEPKPEQEFLSNRSAVASTDVDLSGQWTLIVNDDFKKEYDTYLKRLGQPSLVRSIAISIIGMTTEETKQTDNGRSLWIRGTNVRGVWERTLIASDENNAQLIPIVTADSEKVDSESWWEQEGTMHHSWMRGVTKYGGGNFESIRYLEKSQDNEDGKDNNILVCESIFHPANSKKEKAVVTWRFSKDSVESVSQ